MNEVVCCREEFINNIHNLLITNGLSQVDDSNVWVKEFEVRQGGAVVNINGQQFQQPGEVIKIRYTLELIGEGTVDDTPFEQINFKVQHGDDVMIDMDECIYYEEITLVEHIINRIFR